MKTTHLCTRKYNKETYVFYLNEPSYAGARGCCGVEITPYISVVTPENGFGYTDTILLNHGKAYTLERYLPPYILKQIEHKMIELMVQREFDMYL